MFIIKKLVGASLFPVPVILILLFFGVLLLWIGKWKKTARLAVSLGALLLLLGSLSPVAGALIGSLENRYERFRADAHPDLDPAWIVVLDGGYSDDPDLPAIQRVSTHTITRLMEGLRLSEEYPEATLLLSGGSAFGNTPGSRIMKEAALALGVEEERIQLETESWDTDDQSRNIRAIVGQDRFILVTSASHMPRSMSMFEHQGMTPKPAPAGFESARSPRYWYSVLLPSSLDLIKTRRAFYEYLGIMWAKIRGHI